MMTSFATSVAVLMASLLFSEGVTPDGGLGVRLFKTPSLVDDGMLHLVVEIRSQRDEGVFVTWKNGYFAWRQQGVYTLFELRDRPERPWLIRRPEDATVALVVLCDPGRHWMLLERGPAVEGEVRFIPPRGSVLFKYEVPRSHLPPGTGAMFIDLVHERQHARSNVVRWGGR